MIHAIIKCVSFHLHSRALLQFDTREFLNVLALAFEEPEFTSELGLRQRQRIVDILLLIMVHGEGFTVSITSAHHPIRS